MKTRLATYKKFRQPTNRWIKLSIECAKSEFFSSSKKKTVWIDLRPVHSNPEHGALMLNAGCYDAVLLNKDGLR